MRYFVKVGGRTLEVVIDGDGVTVDGKAVNATLEQVPGTPVHRLSAGGKSKAVVATRAESSGEWELHIGGQHLTVEVVDERTSAIRAMTARSGAAQGPKPVRAPMPGMIVRVEAQAGDKVKAGQGVIIIEAMKMENELRAEAAGTVSKVLVQPGTAVEKGAVLIEFTADV